MPKKAKTTTLADFEMSYLRKTYKRHKAYFSLQRQKGGCYLTKKKPRADGYVRVELKLDGKGYYFYLHHLAMYVGGWVLPDGIKEHVSHLCANPKCFKPSHLVIEPAKANNLRKNCPVSVECPHKCCENKKPINCCFHKPRCIKAVF